MTSIMRVWASQSLPLSKWAGMISARLLLPRNRMKEAITSLSNIRLSTWFLFIINVLIAAAGLAIILCQNNPLGLMVFYLLQPMYIPSEKPEEEELIYDSDNIDFTSDTIH